MVQSDLVTGVRAASRALVRTWGFLGRSVAGTDLPGSAVHALIEIGLDTGVSARELCDRLRLEKSTVSRLLRSLAERGLVREETSTADGRAKHLFLTAAGRQTLEVIDRTAAAQVRDALGRMDGPAQRRVLHGLQDYAAALGPMGQGRKGEQPNYEILRGYTDGLVGRMAEIFAVRIQPIYPFGRAFECKVARELAEFMERAERPMNGTWAALLGGQIVGGITIDGENLGQGHAHLRWFAMAEAADGQGIGKDLLRTALTHCDRRGFSEIHLWTLKGLDAARSLYDREDFVLAEEFTGDQWGASVTEQKFVRAAPVQSSAQSSGRASSKTSATRA